MASYLLVAHNYMLGAYLGFASLSRPVFAIYCVIFANVWFGITVLGGRWLKIIENSEDEQGDSEVSDGNSSRAQLLAI